MATFESRIFGSLPVADDAYWSGATTVGGRQYVRAIFIGTGDQNILDRAASLVDDLDRLDVRARAAIQAAHAADATVRGYVDHHLDAVDADVLERLFGAAKPDDATFLARLELVGVAIHPVKEEHFKLVLDYSLGRDVSDELLAVRFDEAGEVVAVTHES